MGYPLLGAYPVEAYLIKGASLPDVAYGLISNSLLTINKSGIQDALVSLYFLPTGDDYYETKLIDYSYGIYPTLFCIRPS